MTVRLVVQSCSDPCPISQIDRFKVFLFKRWDLFVRALLTRPRLRTSICLAVSRFIGKEPWGQWFGCRGERRRTAVCRSWTPNSPPAVHRLHGQRLAFVLDGVRADVLCYRFAQQVLVDMDALNASGGKGQSSNVNAADELGHLEDASDVGVAVVLGEGNRCGAVREVAAIAEAVAEVAVSTITGANNDVLTTCLVTCLLHSSSYRFWRSS